MILSHSVALASCRVGNPRNDSAPAPVLLIEARPDEIHHAGVTFSFRRACLIVFGRDQVMLSWRKDNNFPYRKT